MNRTLVDLQKSHSILPWSFSTDAKPILKQNVHSYRFRINRELISVPRSTSICWRWSIQLGVACLIMVTKLIKLNKTKMFSINYHRKNVLSLITYLYDQVLVASTTMIIYFGFLCDFFISLHAQSSAVLMFWNPNPKIVSISMKLSQKAQLTTVPPSRWRIAS